MGGNEIGSNSLADIYHQPYDFALSVHEDIPAVFFNMHEFGAIHVIDGHNVPCVLAGMKDNRASLDGVNQFDTVLFVLNKHVNRAVAGMKVIIDGRPYIVGSSRLIQGELWRIELEVYDG